MGRGLLLTLPFLAACMGAAYSAVLLAHGPRRDSNLEPRSVAFSPDGELLLHGAFDGNLGVTRARDGHVAIIHRTRKPYIREVRWSPDGERLLVTTSETVELLDRQGSELLVLGPVYVHAEFGPDGARLALGGWADGRVEIRDARTGSIEHVFAHVPAQVSSVSWSPDGRVVAVGAEDRTIRLLAVASREEVARIVVEPAGWVRVSHAPDGRRLAWYGHQSSVWVRELEAGTEREIERREGTLALAWSPDGGRLALLGPSSLEVWDVASLQPGPTMAPRPGTDRVAWSPDGQYLAASCFLDRTVVWNLRTGATREWDGYPAAFGPDMRFVAFGARVERFERF